MAIAKEHEVAEMFARCDDLVARSQQLGAEHSAVIEELERLLAEIDRALRWASKVE